MHLSRRDGALDLLKWLALLSMLLDHLRYVGISADWLYVPGRLAFPWFCLAMAVNLARGGARKTGWRYPGWLLLFSAVSEIPYRLYIPEPDTLSVMPTLALAVLFAERLMFGLFGALLPLALLLVMRRPWYFSLLPGLVCLAANQWRVLLESAQFGNSVAIFGLGACLIAPGLGMFLLRHAGSLSPPPMRRWAYALYPAHFLLLLALRQAIA